MCQSCDDSTVFQMKLLYFMCVFAGAHESGPAMVFNTIGKLFTHKHVSLYDLHSVVDFRAPPPRRRSRTSYHAVFADSMLSLLADRQNDWDLGLETDLETLHSTPIHHQHI